MVFFKYPGSTAGSMVVPLSAGSERSDGAARAVTCGDDPDLDSGAPRERGHEEMTNPASWEQDAARRSESPALCADATAMRGDYTIDAKVRAASRHVSISLSDDGADSQPRHVARDHPPKGAMGQRLAIPDRRDDPRR
jgi:hypothetical protein